MTVVESVRYCIQSTQCHRVTALAPGLSVGNEKFKYSYNLSDILEIKQNMVLVKHLLYWKTFLSSLYNNSTLDIYIMYYLV